MFGQKTLPTLLVIFLFISACKSARSASPKADDISSSVDSTAVSRYESLDTPIIHRVESPDPGLVDLSETGFTLHTGEYQLSLDNDALLLTRPGKPITLMLHPLGVNFNLAPFIDHIETAEEGENGIIVLSGSTPWTNFTIRLWYYLYNPGLIHYQLELTPQDDLPAGQIQMEWAYVDSLTGEETSPGYEVYSDRAPGAAPSFYGYSKAMDSTLLYWVDLTRLNPFIQAVRYSSISTPSRRGHSFGHILSNDNLRKLPQDLPWVIYDAYLYLTPGEPLDETELFLRYLQEVGDIYDLLSRPSDLLPDWQSLAVETLTALQDPDTWVELDGQRYWRAYVSDTRMSAEAITQLDVGLAAARYASRYGEDEYSVSIIEDSINALQNFYNPNFGLIQNSGPITLSGDQGRGDTWYELGHVLKAAEWGILGESRVGDLALESQAAWTDFAHAVDYQFPQFYNFNTWQGIGREPDTGGGYALYMLRLADLGCGEPCVEEAKSAVQAFPGSGFSFAYETHMTAASALAAAEIANRTNDPTWLNYAYGPIANLIRLSWIYEVDYGKPAPARTFFGLAPTQRAAAITPKEQYEAWIYLGEFLKLAHGQIDPSVEKLISEFYYHSLITLAYSLPPLLPNGVAAEHPAAYETVGTNRLDLSIPLEDMRDGWDVWGSIGQEVYGAGMAPTFAALAYVEIDPGIVVYSGYPLVEIDGLTVTLAGIPGTHTQVKVFGIAEVFDAEGSLVDYWDCDSAICFQAEGGGGYTFRP